MSMMQFQTVERDSVFTRLDFRPKLFMVAIVSTVAFVWESPIALGGLLAFLLIVSLVAGVKTSYIRTIITIMIPFYILLLLTHGFFNTDQVKMLTNQETLTPLFAFPESWPLIGGGGMSVEGFLYGWSVIFKTLSLVLVLPVAIFTTEVNNMIVGMVRARIPYKLVFIFSSTIRFFPLLFEEIQSIIEAQRLRGLAMEKMGPIKRVRVYGKVAIPLILGAMVKSQQLEVVLQSKAFTGSGDRTFLHDSVLTLLDWFVIGLFAVLFVLAVVFYFATGFGRFGWLLYF
jgi:energy-coupling factor transport system permease protein